MANQKIVDIYTGEEYSMDNILDRAYARIKLSNEDYGQLQDLDKTVKANQPYAEALSTGESNKVLDYTGSTAPLDLNAPLTLDALGYQVKPKDPSLGRRALNSLSLVGETAKGIVGGVADFTGAVVDGAISGDVGIGDDLYSNPKNDGLAEAYAEYANNKGFFEDIEGKQKYYEQARQKGYSDAEAHFYMEQIGGNTSRLNDLADLQINGKLTEDQYLEQAKDMGFSSFSALQKLVRKTLGSKIVTAADTISDEIDRIPTGYDPTIATQVQDIKDADGVLDTTGKAVAFGSEQLLSGIATVAAAKKNPQLLYTSIAGNMASQNATNDGEYRATAERLSNVKEAAVISASLDRLGLKAIGGGKGALGLVGATGTEALTEGVQEGVEYLGEINNTRVGLDPNELENRILGGAIASGTVGGVVNFAGQTANRYAQQNPTPTPGTQPPATQPTADPVIADGTVDINEVTGTTSTAQPQTTVPTNEVTPQTSLNAVDINSLPAFSSEQIVNIANSNPALAERINNMQTVLSNPNAPVDMKQQVANQYASLIADNNLDNTSPTGLRTVNTVTPNSSVTGNEVLQNDLLGEQETTTEQVENINPTTSTTSATEATQTQPGSTTDAIKNSIQEYVNSSVAQAKSPEEISQDIQNFVDSQQNANNVPIPTDQTTDNNLQVPKIADNEEVGIESYVNIEDRNVPTQLKVVEAESLSPDIAGTQNQFRDRSRKSSQLQVSKIAQNLEPRRLEDTATLDTGAPTLARDGRTIIAGNGRTQALQQAYSIGTAENYKNSLIDNAEKYGVSKEAIRNMRFPVLVRQLKNDVDVERAAIASNETGSLAMSAMEQARADAARLPDLSTISTNAKGDINHTGNRGLIRQFTQNLPNEARASLLASNGMLSQEGLRRIENAIIYKAYGDTKAVSDAIENPNINLKNAVNALVNVAPAVVSAKDSIQQGVLNDADISNDIASAVATLQQIKNDPNNNVESYLANQGLFQEDELSPVARELIQYIEDNIRSTKAITELLNAYYDNLNRLGDPNQQDLLGNTPSVDTEELLNQTIEEVTRAQEQRKQSRTSRQQSLLEEEQPTVGQTDTGNQRGSNQEQSNEAGPSTSQEGLRFSRTNTQRLAPNGEPSNLTPEQYRQVRTPAFKQWFGDWENDPENASKVVDENGEPLVVYHGTDKDFNAFDDSKTGTNDLGLWGRGHYFASSPETANSYAMRQGDGAKLIPAFISLRNPLVLKTGADLIIRLPDGRNHRELVGSGLDGSKIKEIALNENNDGVIQFLPNGNIGDVVAYKSNQVKSAIGNTGEFSNSNDDIRYSRNPKNNLLAPNGEQSNLTPEQYAQVRTPEFKAWFGDWQNDPETASKVLDENGEPKIMYHQTDANWTVYDTSKSISGRYDNETPFGVFTKSTNRDIGLGDTNIQMELYVDIKNPIYFSNREEARQWYSDNIPGYSRAVREQQKNDDKYSALLDEAEAKLEPILSQLRKDSQNMTTEEYRQGVKDAYAESGKILEEWQKTNNDVYSKGKGLVDDYLKNSDYDGVILDVDSGSFGRTTDATIALSSNQIKSATNNDGRFSPEDNDIRFSVTDESGKNYATPQDQDSARTAIENALGKSIASSLNIRVTSSPEMAGVEGYHDRNNNETVILLDNIHPVYDVDGNQVMSREERAVWVAWHESYHRGTSLAGDNVYRETLANARTNPFISELTEQMQLAHPDYTLDIATEEALAELSAGLSTDRLDVLSRQYDVSTPNYTGIRALVNNWITSIKNIINRIIGKEVVLSDLQVADLVSSVGQLAIEQSLGNTTIHDDAKFSESQVNTEDTDYLDKLFSFAGRRSKDADKQNLKQAVELDKKGRGNEAIRSATGWFKGVDGKWRYEIDDSQADVSDLFRYYINTHGVVAFELQDFLSHDQLYQAYPHLKDTVVQIVNRDEGKYGSYSPSLDRININNRLSVEEARSTLLHEIQHAIQEFEGFATGTNANVARDVLERVYGTKDEVESSIQKKEKRIDNLDNKLRINSNKLLSIHLYDSSKKLREYAMREKPSSVWRHIRNHIGAYHHYRLAVFDDKYRVSKENHERVREAYRNFQGLPRRNSSYKFNAELSDVMLELSNAYERVIPNSEMKKIENNYKKYYKHLRDQRSELVKKRSALKKQVNIEQGIFQNYNTYDDYTIYRNTAGEAEARLVQQRLSLTEQDRANTRIEYDVPTENQIVVTPNQINNLFNRDEVAESYSLDNDIETQQEAVRSLYQNTDQWLKAPNGQNTNLTEDQWVNVRTPQFKAWFGDWELDPSNASKVVDANGEPLVVYHGTRFDFNTFDINELSKNTENNGFYGAGFYFASDINEASEYGPTLINAFLNIRNPLYDSQEDLAQFADYLGYPEGEHIDITEITEEGLEGLWFTQELIDKGYDGVLAIEDSISPEFVAFNANQIKSATDNTGAYSPLNDDIRYSTRPPELEVAKEKRLRDEALRVAQDEGLIASGKLLADRNDIIRDVSKGNLITAWNRSVADTKPGNAIYDSLYDSMGELQRLKEKFGGLAGTLHDKFRLVGAKIQEEIRVKLDPRIASMTEKLASKYNELEGRYEDYQGKYGKAQFLYDLDMIGKYVLHGKERNLTVFINSQGEQTDGSGKTNQEIDELTAYYEQRPELIEFYKTLYTEEIKPLIELRNDELFQGGILTQEMIDAQYDWQWYVPLKGEATDAIIDPVTGKVLNDVDINQRSIFGENNPLGHKELPKMGGRHGTEADSLFGTIFNDAQIAIQRNMMQEPKKALLDYAMTDEGKANLKANVRRVVDTKQFKVAEDGSLSITQNTLNKDENTVVYKDGNEMYLIQVKNKRALEAMKNVTHSFGDDIAGKALRGISNLTRLNSSVWTRFSPAFQLVNKIRDAKQHYILLLADAPTTPKGKTYSEAIRNLSSRLNVANMSAKNNVRYTASLASKVKGTPNAAFQEYEQYLDIFRKEGGVTTYSDLLKYDKLKSVEREFTKRVGGRDAMPKKALDGIVRFFDGIGDHVELTSRVAMFKALLDSGVDQTQAALYVKDTMNFETKGQTGRFLGAFHAFSTAIIYDTRRTASALFRNKEGHIMFLTLFMAKMLEMALADWFGEDDEDGISYIDKQSFYQAMGYNNFVFGERGEGIKIPAGWGLSRVAGGSAVIARRLANGRMTPAEARQTMMMDVVMGNFSPVQIKAVEGDVFNKLAQSVAPTVYLPQYQIDTNKSFTGSNVYKNEAFRKKGYLEYESGYDWTEDTYKLMAKALYDVTGVDVHPETIKLQLRAYVPMSTEMMQLTELVIDGLQGNADSRQTSGKIPFVSKFASFPPRYEQRLYRTRSDKIEHYQDVMISAERNGDEDTYQDYKDKNIKRWVTRINKVDKSMRKLNEKSDKIKERYEGEELVQKLRELEDEEKKLLIKFNRMYEEEFYDKQ